MAPKFHNKPICTPEPLVCSGTVCREREDSMLEALADMASRMVWMADSCGERIYFNRRWQERLGYGTSDLVEGKWLELIHPDDRDRIETTFRNAVSAGSPWHVDYRLKLKDGSYLAVEECGRPFATDNADIGGMLGTTSDFRDVSEAARGQAQERAGLGNWVWEVGTRRISWDATVSRILGLSVDSATPGYQQFRRMVHPDDLAALKLAVARSLQTGEPYELEHRVVLERGSVRHLVETGIPEYDESGRPVRMIGTMRDVTRRRESEIALRTIFDSSYDAIFIHDFDGTLIEVNHKVLELYQVSAEEALRYTIAEDYSSRKNDLAGLSDKWERACAGETLIFEWLARRPGDGGEFPVEVILRRVDLGAREVVIANVRDITERRRLEQNLLLASRVLENSIEGITVTDADGIIEMVNPAFTTITGYSPEEAIGKTPRVLRSDRHTPAFYEEMWDSLLTKGAWSGEIWNRRKGGEAYPEWLSISAIADHQGKTTHYVGIFHDITEIKKSQERLRHQAYHDALTGLPNRALFSDRLEMAVHHAARHDLTMAVVFLDLDHFKHVNDSLGHAAGDELLQEASRRLKRIVREEDTVCRLGGDEFTVILADIEGAGEVAQICERIQESIGSPFQLRGQEVYIGTSMGISIYPLDGRDAETLTKHADMAMYRAKEQGRGNYQFFTLSLAERAMSRIWLEAEMRRALDREEFCLYYQPKIDLTTGQVAGVEALVRWQKEDGTMVGPDRFIPLAEETGLIIPLGEWVLGEAFRQMKCWEAEGLPSLVMAINLSARQFMLEDLPERIHSLAQTAGIDSCMVELEVTESLLVKDIDQAIVTLLKLKGMGFRLALDDFGTGYSSLSYLKRLPFDTIKIDRSFVSGIPEDFDDLTIATAIASMAKALQLTIVAEGVEKAEQANFLAEIGCTYVQGYFFSRPVPAQEIPVFVAAHQASAG